MSFRATIESAISKTKNMKKTDGKTGIIQRISARSALLVAGCLLVLGASIPLVRADTLQQQIDSLSAQNDQAEGAVSDLQLQASSYQDAINKLQGEISAIQKAIAANEAKQVELQAEINADQKKLDYEKQVLGEDIKAMYVNGSMSTVEMLATSKNLSDFVDAETYRNAVQTKIQNTMAQIAALQNQLEQQQQQVQLLLSSQKQQRTQLAGAQAQQQQLLAMNQSQQASYNNQIASNKKKITALEAEQAAINAASTTNVNLPPSGGSGGACDVGYGNGGYPLPWCNATEDSVLTSGSFPNRECTSFAYWYFTTDEGKSLSVWGNAKDWAYTSSRPVSQTPHRGDIFVKTAGPYGHVGIVLALGGETYEGYTVPSDEVLTMSMNYDYAGHFHTSAYATSSLLYIH
jgi:peptidoglycan hydrolase CwlO-like protein/surface antigen